MHRAPNCSKTFQYHKAFWNISLLICATACDIQRALLLAWKVEDRRVCWPVEQPMPLFWLPRPCNTNHLEALENEHECDKTRKWDSVFILSLKLSKKSCFLCIVHVVLVSWKPNNMVVYANSKRLKIWHTLEYSNDMSNHSSTICLSLYVLNL